MNEHEKPSLVEVELWSADPAAVEAVRATLKQLPGGAADLVERDGKFFVADGFPAYACQNQGYVKRVIRSSATPSDSPGEGAASSPPPDPPAPVR